MTDFNAVVSLMTWDLRQAFPLLSDDDIAAIGGNGAHESGGFRIMQEIKPTIAGSRGGYGYFQWTGPRRKAFEAWCKSRGLSVDSTSANVGFLIYELQTSEAGAIGRVRAAKGLEAKVKAFELGYERAGVKHYDSRIKWAKKFRAAMPDRKPQPPEVEALKPPPPKPIVQSTTNAAAGGIGIIAALAMIGDSIKGAKEALAPVLDLLPADAMKIASGITIVLAIYIIRERLKKRAEHGV